MPSFFAHLLCKWFGHKGPEGTTYSVKPVTAQAASMKWVCPRCGERQHGVMLGSDKPGNVFPMGTDDTTHNNVGAPFILGTRMDMRYRQPILEQIAAGEDAVIIGGAAEADLIRQLKSNQ